MPMQREGNIPDSRPEKTAVANTSDVSTTTALEVCIITKICHISACAARPRCRYTSANQFWTASRAHVGAAANQVLQPVVGLVHR